MEKIDLSSLGLLPMDELGFKNEDELLEALVPLMQDNQHDEVLIAS